MGASSSTFTHYYYTGLLSDAEYRRQLGETARARVQAEFTHERMAAETLELYHEVLAEAQGSVPELVTSCLGEHRAGDAGSREAAGVGW